MYRQEPTRSYQPLVPCTFWERFKCRLGMHDYRLVYEEERASSSFTVDEFFAQCYRIVECRYCRHEQTIYWWMNSYTYAAFAASLHAGREYHWFLKKEGKVNVDR